jgi:hypothetical protein
VKILTPIIALYFLVIFPSTHLVFSGNRFIYEFGFLFYFALVLAIALSSKRVSLLQLGFSKNNTGKPIRTGLLLGMLPVVSVILLDSLIVKTGLSQSELLTGADLRNPEQMGFYMSPAGNVFSALVVPFLDQVFVMGLIVNNLFTKENTGRTIISGGLLYSLFHFRLSIGNLFLGMISAGLLKGTGSILVPILMHIGFAMAEFAIVFYYPRLLSILVFFV